MGEQNYQRYREERFRQTSENTNQRVLWWALAQTGILLVMGAWQMRHLKSFLRPRNWSRLHYYNFIKYFAFSWVQIFLSLWDGKFIFLFVRKSNFVNCELKFSCFHV